MREDICSIPIHDVFLPRDGCPFCRMRDMLEDRMATYITGAAMMEPDVRIETNRLGFCEEHFNQILARGSRLSVALILESLLQEIREEAKLPLKKRNTRLEERAHSCFVCDSLEKNTAHLMDSMLKLWQTDPEFRQLYAQQEYICLPHSLQVMTAAQRLPKKLLASFQEDTDRLTLNYLDALCGDVTHFCRMFDYRNAGGDWGNSRDSIERSIRFLTSRQPQDRQKADEKNR